jgi:hypothetical protein
MRSLFANLGRFHPQVPAAFSAAGVFPLQQRFAERVHRDRERARPLRARLVDSFVIALPRRDNLDERVGDLHGLKDQSVARFHVLAVMADWWRVAPNQL